MQRCSFSPLFQKDEKLMTLELRKKYSYAKENVTHKKYDYIYLSPHLDDVSFSCSGAICHSIQQGLQVLIVTIFAAEPRPPFSPLAQIFHQFWQIPEDTSPYQIRKKEDEEAMRALGVDYVWLDWLDVIYRDSTLSQFSDLNDYETLFSHDPAFPLLQEWLIDLHATYPDATIVAPLGIGGHRDHCIVFQAALQSLEHASLAFFEDFPYAAYSPEKIPELAQLHSLSPFEVDISHYLEQRIYATSLYQSQHPILFYPSSSFPEIIKGYTQKEDHFVERFWRFPR